MKISGTAAALTAISVVLLSAFKVYIGDAPDDEKKLEDPGTAIAAQRVYAEESGLVTVPISAFKSGSMPETTEISITFLGDCILSSNIDDTRQDSFIRVAEEVDPAYFFEKAVPYYAASDYVIADCETVLSDRSLFRSGKDGTAFWFKSPESFSEIFAAGCVDAVSLANNHTMDYGEEGYSDTIAALTGKGITWGDSDNPIYFEKNGITFGIICTKLFSENYDSAITEELAQVTENSDIQIIFFHGGEEYEHLPEDWLRECCHKYVDMGADLIVGSHPHVLRPMEEYNGVDIIYSIGNFCYGANRQPENRTVILTETFRFDEDGAYLGAEESFTPFYVYSGDHNNWQPTPIADPLEQSKTLSFMYGAADNPVAE